MLPTANEMAVSIQAVAGKLLNAAVLEPQSYGTLSRLIGNLKQQGDTRQWSFSVDRDAGFVFKPLADNSKDTYNPIVSVDGIAVDDTIEGRPPIIKLDISLELRYQRIEERILRWHFDQANIVDGSPQPGPLFHLQFGGHAHIDRSKDMQISEPRWCHPPMDLILILEAVTANFFPNEWETLREDRAWCSHIRLAQRYCLKHYSDKLAQHLAVSQGTVLSAFWADRWSTAA